MPSKIVFSWSRIYSRQETGARNIYNDGQISKCVKTTQKASSVDLSLLVCYWKVAPKNLAIWSNPGLGWIWMDLGYIFRLKAMSFERSGWCAQKRNGENPLNRHSDYLHLFALCTVWNTWGTSLWMVSLLMLCDVTYEIKTSLMLGSRAWQRCWENFPTCHLAPLGTTWPTFRDEFVPEPTYFDAQVHVKGISYDFYIGPYSSNLFRTSFQYSSSISNIACFDMLSFEFTVFCSLLFHEAVFGSARKCSDRWIHQDSAQSAGTQCRRGNGRNDSPMWDEAFGVSWAIHIHWSFIDLLGEPLGARISERSRSPIESCGTLGNHEMRRGKVWGVKIWDPKKDGMVCYSEEGPNPKWPKWPKCALCRIFSLTHPQHSLSGRAQKRQSKIIGKKI